MSHVTRKLGFKKRYSISKKIFLILPLLLLPIAIVVANGAMKKSTEFRSQASTNQPESCIFPDPINSTLSEYAKKQNFNVGGLIDECFNKKNTQQELCKQTAAKEYKGMFVPYQVWWPTTEPTRGVFNFAKFDEQIAFAKNNGIKLHYYHLIWSDWLYSTPGDCGNWSTADLDSIMKNRIQTTIKHGGDTVVAWNVVNEAFSRQGTIERRCFAEIGPELYLDKAFRYAREATPTGFLILSDNFGTDEMYRPKVDGLFAYVKGAKSRGVPIDAVGIENHLLSKNGYQFTQTYLNDLAYIFAKARDAKVKVLITEMDVYQAGHSQTDVAKIYKNVTAMCLKESNCISFETWGISDKFSWPRVSARLNLPDALPLLFDDNYHRKTVVYNAVMEAIKENTTRSCPPPTPKPTPTPIPTTPTPKPSNTPAPTLTTDPRCFTYNDETTCVSKCGAKSTGGNFNCMWSKKNSGCYASIIPCTH